MKISRIKFIGVLLLALVLSVGIPLSMAGCGSHGNESSGAATSSDDISSGVDPMKTDSTATDASVSSGVSQTTSAGQAGNSSTGTQAAVTSAGSGSKVAVPGDLGSGKTYYVSSSTGNDGNNGLSPDKAFKTVAPVNKLALTAGDNILFKRGDVFKGAHLEPKGSGEAASGKWITIDAYGSGDKPVFKSAEKLKAAISLSALLTTKGYRIRNIEINDYLAGIVIRKGMSAALAFDGLEITNVTIRNITTNKPYGTVQSFPEKLDAGYGLYMERIKNAKIVNLSVISADIPVRMYGELTLFDNLYVYDSRVTGVMLYGEAFDSTYDAVMNSVGGIVVQNSRVLYTGLSGLGVGTTGFMIENTKGSVIKDTEIAYTVNGTGANDGCALDWEQLNINCTIENVYAHDNEGPFLLAMEHPENIGSSRGNKVVNCLSVNNCRRDHTAGATFIDNSGYSDPVQRITVQNCIDIGMPGSVPYSYWGSSKQPMAELSSKYIISNGFTSGVMDVYATFDEAGLGMFASSSGAAIKNSHLSLSSGGSVRTSYSGSNYVVSSWLKGKAELVFMANGGNGYAWRFESGKIVAQKLSGGKAATIKTINVSGLNTGKWYRARVEVSNGTIKTYVDDVLVDTLKDSAYTSGTAGINAVNDTLADEFFVYRYANSARAVESYTTGAVAGGGRLTFRSSSGAYDEPEINWTAGGNYSRYIYRAHGCGRLDISGKGAYIQYNSASIRTSGGYDKVHVYLANATASSVIYIDFSTDGGSTWHTKSFAVRAMSSENEYPFKSLCTEFNDYVADMSDMPEWTGTINGLRIRTDASSGYISIKSVIISQ